MTSRLAESRNGGHWLLAVAAVVGALLIADSLSQWVQASLPFRTESREWRTGTLGLLFTQATPLVIGLLLLSFGMIRTRLGWRLAGVIGCGLALLVLALAVVYARDSGTLDGSLGTEAMERLQRSSRRTLVGATVFGFGLLGAGFLLLREGLRPRPADR